MILSKLYLCLEEGVGVLTHRTHGRLADLQERLLRKNNKKK